MQVRSKYNEIEELKRQEESRQQRILRAKEELISAEEELANLPPYEPPKNELVSCTFFHGCAWMSLKLLNQEGSEC